MNSEVHFEVHWSEPNNMWIVYRVRTKDMTIERHEWVEEQGNLESVIRRMAY